MDLNSFNYNLPDELIADSPLGRGLSKMMAIDKSNGVIRDMVFTDILEFIDDRTTVVFNKTKVIPARLFGKRETGGIIEFLLLSEKENGLWEAMAKDFKRIRQGDVITLDGSARIIIEQKMTGTCLIRFELKSGELMQYLEQYGDIPLPPYILKRRGEKKSRVEDRAAYQTVYAETSGSVAAPTAGFHFSPEILEKVKEKTGGHVEFVVLDVGMGTFQPVKEENIEAHQMHSERYHIPVETAARLNKDKAEGRKILAVGTTTARALESAANPDGILEAGDKDTSIFIYPGYKFRFVEQLLTNFHLPKSTLLMLVSALAGHELMMKAYEHAVSQRYRFYSYGDCMVIL